MAVSFFWFRRDLRIEDNVGFEKALASGVPVIPVFIFDRAILDELPKDDARVTFIYQQLEKIHQTFEGFGCGLLIEMGEPKQVWIRLLDTYDVDTVYTNRDYEPYANERDAAIETICSQKNTAFQTFKDQVIFETSDILKADGLPYTVFTPYKNRWLERFRDEGIASSDPVNFEQLFKQKVDFPSLASIGFEKSSIPVPDFALDHLRDYDKVRDFPAVHGTSGLSTHLRFGTVSIRQIVQKAVSINAIFLSELIWREFFMQILHHFPKVVGRNFRSKYDSIEWRNDEDDFKRWCEGNTGYPIVDAGMRELNATGLMHNRVRMVTASFLCKHLLIDWRWGEAYFAEKLLDYDLSANNGNWQWAAGTGCDAAPYFRVFSPDAQTKRFDPKLEYIRKWMPEIDGFGYPEPMVEHKYARDRALKTYKVGIEAQIG